MRQLMTTKVFTLAMAALIALSCAQVAKADKLADIQKKLKAEKSYFSNARKVSQLRAQLAKAKKDLEYWKQKTTTGNFVEKAKAAGQVTKYGAQIGALEVAQKAAQLTLNSAEQSLKAAGGQATKSERIFAAKAMINQAQANVRKYENSMNQAVRDLKYWSARKTITKDVLGKKVSIPNPEAVAKITASKVRYSSAKSSYEKARASLASASKVLRDLEMPR